VKRLIKKDWLKRENNEIKTSTLVRLFRIQTRDSHNQLAKNKERRDRSKS